MVCGLVSDPCTLISIKLMPRFPTFFIVSVSLGCPGPLPFFAYHVSLWTLSLAFFYKVSGAFGFPALYGVLVA